MDWLHEGTHYRFYSDVTEDKDATREMGKFVAKEVDFVELKAIGARDKTAKRIEKVKMYDARLWGVIEKAYAQYKAGKEMPLDGMPLSEWPMIGRAQAETLIRNGVKTVEALAKLPEEGMALLPLEGRRLQQKAAAYLSADNQVGRVAEEIVAMREDLARMKADLADKDEQIAALKASKRAAKAEREAAAA